LIAINEAILTEIRRLLESQVKAAKDVNHISAMTASEWRDYQAREERVKALFEELHRIRHISGERVLTHLAH
jgi:hypothetical protein